MGAAVGISRTDHTASELRTIGARSDDADETRRLLAIALVLEGATRAEAARRTGMDRRTLRDRVHRYNDVGVEGLVSRKPPGPKPKLTSTQLAELRQLVLKGPDPKVHKVIRWRCVDPRAELARRFAVTVDEITIGRRLRKMRPTRLQPRPHHPRKNPEVQEAIKKNFCSSLRDLLLRSWSGLRFEIWFQDGCAPKRRSTEWGGKAR
jgi:transposase